MLQACLIALATLIIVLYGQVRLEARAIRRNRTGKASGRALVLQPQRHKARPGAPAARLFRKPPETAGLPVRPDSAAASACRTAAD
ncbi:hypothetical protein [Leisingera daeponensis]|uniref:hypothetical protein n=1 Tax=Leisingera daeponensis TaxID=405746 RepID=UPI001C94FF5B|nr:hypothetical protein [Leisingera daeponensis]MBY6057385.1 hypothetical protein [Leisingera daeponensis]